MKKLLLLTVFFTGIVNAQIITIPDPNFKAALINPMIVSDTSGNFLPSVDMNFNGEIEVSEALNIGQLSVDSSSISDMTGIEAFTNLTGLSCGNNQFTSLTLTMLPMLQFFGCGGNSQLTFLDLSGLSQMASLDITNCTALAHIDVSGCAALNSVNISNDALQYLDASNCTSMFSINVVSTGLTFINFDGCTAMNNLSIWSSQLTSVNVHDLPALEYFQVYLNSQLTSLTVTNCPLLATLNCNSNNLSSLQFSGVPNITNFGCGENQLTDLDVSGLPNLNFLFCAQNQLQSLNIKNGSNETSTVFSQNPNLAFICADEGQIAAVQTQADTDGMTGVAISSYCSFTPGGDYNTITGIVRFDGNANGCDVADFTPNSVRINITDGTTTGASFVNNSGNYTFYVQAGNFTIAPAVENPSFFNISPVSAVIPFADNNNNTATQNFCIAPNGIHSDVEMVISPVTPARPGFDAVYKLVYKNIGNQTQTMSLTFTYDDSRLDFVTSSVAPTGTSTGILAFTAFNVRPFENGSILITLHVNAPTDTPPVNVGDVLVFTSFIDISVDENWTNNNFTLTQTVVGSFDPNDITCLEGAVVDASQIGNYLHYAINFENTGTDVAENIVVRMEVDPAQFDLDSLQLLNTSHAAEARITGNVVEFVFMSVNLAIGGHGHILLKLKTDESLVVGSMVSRRAGIYFDYNLPVDTGAADTTFQILKVRDFNAGAVATIYPNPTSGMITVKSGDSIKSVSVYDVQGCILATLNEESNDVTIDMSNYNSGIYMLKILTDKGETLQKIIRE